MFETPPRCRSFLLTVWEERSADPASAATWRFSLEDARTGRRRGFAGLEALVVALRQEVAGERATQQGPQAGPEGRAPGGAARGGEEEGDEGKW